MASNTDLSSVDRARQDLESSVNKLRNALRFWQTWEAEYEGFKEELEALETEPTVDEMVALGVSFGGTVINEKEIKDLIGLPRTPRTRTQVIAGLSHRAETGRKNAEMMQKRIEAEEQKLESLAAISDAKLTDDHGNPLMEIFEELDDDDNVVSSRLTNADKAADQLDSLIKKQMGKAEDALSTPSAASTAPSTTPSLAASSLASEPPKQLAVRPKPEASTPKSSDQILPKAQHKPVANPAPPLPSDTSLDPLLAALKDASPHPPNIPKGDNVMLEVNEHDEIIGYKPLDAVTNPSAYAPHKDEMLQNMREIGPVVATMDIEDDTDSEWDDVDESSSEEENEYGMVDIRSQMSDDYVAEMEALMRKHSLAMENVGPTRKKSVLESVAEDIATEDVPMTDPPPFEVIEKPAEAVPSIAVVEPIEDPLAYRAKPLQSALSKGKNTNGKPTPEKSVRFSDDLDVSPAPPSKSSYKTAAKKAAKASTAPVKPAPVTAAVAEAIVERKAAPEPPKVAPPTKKMSRFKAKRLDPDAAP
ncbi:hypothetical protein EJ06DRAFT_531811 [Trichodelitschia bisporula]|uniref:DUF3835 domain-containing protein n=1 Tax=Trichodelitschia bisporula TaxID=703511 RepID=A0A6G1HSK0_9PEZI|nr:hypothetical protein EJ06DRAFT_531811 [Trichodelitschia bisporula]